jgi:peptidoglycan/xylan/chitin deacetylase (PgdA/CDA1 family)
MFQNEGIRGHSLRAKEVCLTFDDGPGETASSAGPGPRTLQLARFLEERGISATFFVVGRFVMEHPEIMHEVSKLGHIIGNHTYDHTNLRGMSGDDAADQIIATERLLNEIPRIEKQIVKPFRPPQGWWSAALAEQLNSTEAGSCTGPFLWDIPTQQGDEKTADWRCWLRGESAEACAEAYISELRAFDHGIVLMHDGLYEDAPRSGMYPLQMVQIVVDWLQRKDYRFVALNSVLR